MKALQRLVSERLAELDESTRVAAARSEGLVTHNTLHMLASGKHSGRLESKTIKGLVLALRVDEEAVRAAVIEDSAPARMEEVTKDVLALPPEKRDAVIAAMRAAVEEHKHEQENKKREKRPYHQ